MSLIVRAFPITHCLTGTYGFVLHGEEGRTFWQKATYQGVARHARQLASADKTLKLSELTTHACVKRKQAYTVNILFIRQLSADSLQGHQEVEFTGGGAGP